MSTCEIARYAAVFAADAGTEVLYTGRITDEVADLCVAVAVEAVNRRDAADREQRDYYPLAFVEAAALYLHVGDAEATLEQLFAAGQREVDLLCMRPHHERG